MVAKFILNGYLYSLSYFVFQMYVIFGIGVMSIVWSQCGVSRRLIPICY